MVTKINEIEMLEMLNQSKNIGLVEPHYRRKIIPLGLAKISNYCKNQGKNVFYKRNYISTLSQPNIDLVCVTSLFTNFTDEVLEALKKIRLLAPKSKIILGGIAASLIPNHFDKISNLHIFTGTSNELDRTVPDYSFDYELEGDWNDFSFTFTSRGCPNRCPYCAVWRLEPNIGIIENWREHIIKEKPYAMISDNNLSAQPLEHIENVINYLIENNKKALFDNGFDCKHITKEFAELIARIKYVRCGCRMAFDRIEEDGTFQTAVERLKTAGVNKSQIMAYVLFNFLDTPQEANYRMEVCKKLGIRPYPTQFMPLNQLDSDKKYIGKFWTPKLTRAFRYFWLMAGYYQKNDFVSWVTTQKKLPNLTLSSEDWEAWNYKKP